ncbi:MAG TPA: insulinase family protein, partial [Candidatus Acidoferrales bacterium]
MDEELARLIQDGPTPEELKRVKTQYRAGFIRGIERIGGFGGKSDVLAINEVYGGSPDFYKQTLVEVAGATADDLRGTASQWLSDGVYVLEVRPFPKYETVASNVDRSKVPEAGAPPVARFPQMQRATLSNGLKVILVERSSIPQVNFSLLLDSGWAADQSVLPGTTSLAMDLLDEGTKTRSALQISEELQQLGANLNVGSDLDTAWVSLSALTENLDASLDLYADTILNPSFPAEELDRQRKRRLAQIQQEKVNPQAMALRVLPKLLYGPGHAYGNPATGTGSEESVTKMTRDDLAKFHSAWFKPNNATLIVVGDTKMAEIQPKLEKLFAGWKAGDVPKKNLSAVADAKQPSVYILDRPGAIQSVILAAQLAPPRNNPNDIPILTMNRILGGDFTSRINMNLREDKHWSYGSRTILPDARGQRPYFVLAPVQTDKTKESVQEVQKELDGILGAIPITADELDKAKSTLTLTLPGQWETMNAVSNSISQIVNFGLDDNYFNTFPEKVRALRLEDVTAAAKSTVRPGAMVWVIVGDRAKIEEGIRSLNLGVVQAL